MAGKVIGLGFHKTGTTTLGIALEILGYKVKGTTPRALIPILKGNFKKVLNIVKKYNALQDSPWFMIYKEFDELLPESKFILTVREEESWYKSISRHMGDLRRAQLEWIYGRGKGLPKDDKDHALNTYRKHNQDVANYFKGRENDFIIIDFAKGEGWEKLCRLLGKEIPNVPFPHANKKEDNKRTGYNLKEKLRIFRRRIKNNLTIKYIDVKKLW